MEYPAEENGFRYIPFRIYQVGNDIFNSTNCESLRHLTSWNTLVQNSRSLCSNWKVFSDFHLLVTDQRLEPKCIWLIRSRLSLFADSVFAYQFASRTCLDRQSQYSAVLMDVCRAVRSVTYPTCVLSEAGCTFVFLLLFWKQGASPSLFSAMFFTFLCFLIVILLFKVPPGAEVLSLNRNSHKARLCIEELKNMLPSEAWGDPVLYFPQEQWFSIC